MMLKIRIFQQFIFVASFILFTSAAPAEDLAVSLSINPIAAITDDLIRIECRTRRIENAGAVTYTVKRNGEDFASLQVLCANNAHTVKKSCDLPGCQTDASTCGALVIEKLVARRDTLEGEYTCDVQLIDTSFRRFDDNTDAPVRLTVGDKTPPIDAFTVKSLDTGLEIVNASQHDAGTNVSVVCQTQAASPEPAFLVTITGRESRTNLTVGHQVAFHEQLPREILVTFTCEAYNGFGERQVQRLFVATKYPVIASEITVPTEVNIQSESDIEICSARNHPSEKLIIQGIDSGLLQPGYPKFVQELGVSRVFVRLSQKATEVKDARLEYSCSNGKTQSVTASVVLIASNAAMMTAGIVIAAIVAFFIIVAGIAYALKRRSASPKPQASDKTGYGPVNQNDAAISTSMPRAALL